MLLYADAEDDDDDPIFLALLLADGCDDKVDFCAVAVDDNDDANNEPNDTDDNVSSCGCRCVIDNGLYPLNAARGFGKLPGTTDPCNGSIEWYMYITRIVSFCGPNAVRNGRKRETEKTKCKSIS